jgi:hypothetical protein
MNKGKKEKIAMGDEWRIEGMGGYMLLFSCLSIYTLRSWKGYLDRRTYAYPGA